MVSRVGAIWINLVTPPTSPQRNTEHVDPASSPEVVVLSDSDGEASAPAAQSSPPTRHGHNEAIDLEMGDSDDQEGDDAHYSDDSDVKGAPPAPITPAALSTTAEGRVQQLRKTALLQHEPLEAPSELRPWVDKCTELLIDQARAHQKCTHPCHMSLRYVYMYTASC